VRNDGAISGNSRSCSARHPTRDCLRSLTYANLGHRLVTEKSHVFDLLKAQNNPMCDNSDEGELAGEGAVRDSSRRDRLDPCTPGELEAILFGDSAPK
jgi:hypothetical protein